MIKNIPYYAEGYPYIVAREVDGDDWFWGAYDTAEVAEKVAREINGFVVFNPNYRRDVN